MNDVVLERPVVSETIAETGNSQSENIKNAAVQPEVGCLQMASLGSGSSGNSTIIRSQNTTLLLDCGFTLKETLLRLSQLGVAPTELDAVLVTHEHSDHTKGLGPIARKFNLPVWMTYGTCRAFRDKKLPRVHQFHAHDGFTIGDIHVDPFPTPHDAAESCQFVFGLGEIRFACLTDLGTCTSHVMDKVQGVDALLLESNYDLQMLKNGPYPPSLQSRIMSQWGHLGNEQAGELLASLDHDKLQRIFLGHLSERNNTEQMALETVRQFVARDPDRISVLQQHQCSDWYCLKSQSFKSG